MTVNELVRLLQNKVAALNGLRLTAFSKGDVEQVVALDEQIAETQVTLDQLRTLP